MPDAVAPGAVFVHPRMLEPDWKPDLRKGEKYTDAPKARCVVTSVRGDTAYFRYLDSPTAEGVFTAYLVDVARWRRAAWGRDRREEAVTEETTVRWRDLAARQGRNDLPSLLARHWPDLSEDDLRKAIADSWTMAEWPEQHIDADGWTMLFDRGGYQVDGRSAERESDLPELVTVHRGAGANRRMGMSWTSNPEQAHWFAHRFAEWLGAGKVYVATVPREYVLARFHERRGEDEYVLAIGELSEEDVEEYNPS